MERVEVDRRDGRTILSGTVGDTQAHERALSLATALGGTQVTDLLQVAGSQMVAVDGRFVAVSDPLLLYTSDAADHLTGSIVLLRCVMSNTNTISDTVATT